ncbi:MULTISPECIES: xanthine dehydrogenase family protein molybdopterin-binding subunit [unclassified Leisingera]|uniref:xanthine dehydrogenase family protein molybdopterin-binding subunit n=1 Tax=unclassified Leisingera TaxID=2614906 RepID=UPI000306EF3D|nr:MULTISPECIES: molybdopterin cofactor-binding domain-containing protein [unclassified Leisingera]KIC23873.1 isoquinoline 1-oxidoreductase [Leisingera sp. ANG-S3]KIC53383.1 isoquinoline 1-oxidoreductase [Leisingera sp. ANG-S]KID08168.1 isoquinoline 1-oxidoreductase [Leisingera sp. ANG1]
MASFKKIARRSFLIGSAAIVGGVAFGAYYVSRPAPNPLKPADGEAAFNPFVMISHEKITLIAPRAEMGQGVHTTWAALIAEELDVTLDQVEVIHGPAATAYYNSALLGEVIPSKGYDKSRFIHSLGEALGHAGKLMDMQVTGGSSSMKDGYERMRAAGASARETLKLAAANRLGIASSQLSTKEGKVIAPGNIEIAYTDLAAEAAGLEPVEAQLRHRSEWKLLGKAQPRVDMPGKATGTAKFGIDMRLPGMKFAALKANPHLGGSINGFDASEALQMPGVEQVVDLGNAFAVVANNTWLAIQAAEAVAADWGPAPIPDTQAEIQDAIRAAFDAEPNSTLRDDGDVSALPQGAQEVSAEYEVPFLAHATMEPLNATALYDGSKLQLWSGNQGPLLTRNHCADALGIDPEQVQVNTSLMGGGFGRRGEMDFSVYAAKLARQMPGTPVQLTWSREEDMTHDFYRPGAMARMRGAVKDGSAVLLDGQIASQALTPQLMSRWFGMTPAGPDTTLVDGAFNQPYGIPNYRIRGHAADLQVPIGAWRSVGASFNGFFMESFMDEMAHAAGADPLEFRLALTRQEWAPAAKVLEAVKEMSGWTGKTPDGVGRGVAMTYSFGTPVAQVIEVTEEGGLIRLRKAWIAADLGVALDPQNLEAQMFGGMAYGLSAAMFGEITFAEGAAEQGNFPDYDAIRMHTMPEVEVRILEEQSHISGAGEPGTPPAAPALANALFDLTGKRARRLPLMHDFDLLI